jgi:subtilase family serine protease
MRILFSVLTHFLLAQAVMATNWVEMEELTRFDSPFEAQETDKAAPHQCTFHMVGLNGDVLEKFVADISDPRSANYGKHLRKDQVHEMTSDTEGMAKVTEYLVLNGATITKQSSSSITADATVGAWEQMLHTTFYNVPNPSVGRSTEGAVLHLARHYYLPDNIAPHVRTVMNTVQLPIVLSKGPVRRASP